MGFHLIFFKKGWSTTQCVCRFVTVFIFWLRHNLCFFFLENNRAESMTEKDKEAEGKQ